MKLRSAATKFSAMIMAGVIALSGAGTVFAADNSTERSDESVRPNSAHFEEMSTIYQSALDSLVNDGTLTKAQAEAVTESIPTKAAIRADGSTTKSGIRVDGCMTKAGIRVDGSTTKAGIRVDGSTTKAGITADGRKIERFGEHKGFLSTLVSDGTITQEQLDAVQSAMKTAKASGKAKSDILTELVSAGTITQEQADALNSNEPAKNGETLKNEALTQEEKSATAEHKGFLNKLITDGTITKEQADAICSAVKEAKDAAKDSE